MPTKLSQLVRKYCLGNVIVLMVLSLLSGLIPPVQTYLISVVIRRAAKLDAGFVLSVVCMLASFGGAILFSVLLRIETLALRRKLMETFEKDFMRHILTVPYVNFEDVGFFNLIGRFNDPVGIFLKTLTLYQNAVQYTITIAGYLRLMVNISPFSLLIFISVYPLAVFINLREQQRLRKMRVERSVNDRKEAYLSSLFTDRASLKEQKIYSFYPYVKTSFVNLAGENITAREKVMRFNFFKGIIPLVCNTLFVVINVAFISLSAAANKVEISSAISLCAAFPAIGVFISWNIPYLIGQLKESGYIWQDYKSLAGMESPQMKMISDKSTKRWNKSDRFEFKDVSFSYPQNERQILKGLNFSIKEGEKILIVGRNGCGKSTLIKLLIGLYSPNEGSVCINGRNIDKLNDKVRTNLFSAVFQDFVIFESSIRDNIEMGSSYSNEQLNSVLRSVKLENKINQLPMGLDTRLGTLYEDSALLSGGEAQRLALARCLVRKAKCYIFDEPTSSLDPSVESEIYESIIANMPDKTCVLISHRMAIAPFVDRIICINDGCIVQQGTHKELVNTPGLYKEMYEMQAEHFR